MLLDALILIENIRNLLCSPELLIVVEVEKLYAAQTAANIKVSTVAICSVEAIPASLATGS